MRVENKSFYADLFSNPASAIPPGALKAAKAAKAIPDEASVRRAPPTASATPPSPRPLAEAENLPATENLPAAGNMAGETRAQKTSPTINPSPLAELIGNVDTHNLTPRRMEDLSLDLYAAGAISFDDYSLLAFQPELHPDFNRTIGALTGEQADPDRPRDFVSLWDDRAAFQRRHNAGRNDLIEQSERIASMLRRIDSPTNVIV